MAQRSVEGLTPDVRKQIARAEVSELVKAYVAKNGVRRFGNGDSGDYHGVKQFPQDRGYHMTQRGTSYTLMAPGQCGRPRLMAFTSIMKIVDDIRISEGLEPIKARRSAA